MYGYTKPRLGCKIAVSRHNRSRLAQLSGKSLPHSTTFTEGIAVAFMYSNKLLVLKSAARLAQLVSAWAFYEVLLQFKAQGCEFEPHIGRCKFEPHIGRQIHFSIFLEPRF
ncbi:hypothetical protein VTL71DRAFT_11430 [Oculimacula yallundae]|uniref:Uncharacterized protein n=1 Tax=Oculimacula yallundae TaxID=86028 RepID=A0ABR4CQJ9_9HELO